MIKYLKFLFTWLFAFFIFTTTSFSISKLKLINTAEASGCQGCCSAHVGIQGCDYSSGYLMCEDGQTSPTCECACLTPNFYMPTGSNGGRGGGGGVNPNIIAGGLLGATMLGVIAYGASQNREATNFNNAIGRYKKIINSNQQGLKSENVETGTYVSKKDTCAVFPYQMELEYGEAARQKALVDIEKKLNTNLDKKSKNEWERKYLKIKYENYPIPLHFFYNTDKELITKLFIYQDGTALMAPINSDGIVCAGRFERDSNFKRLNLYCDWGNSSYCQVQYLVFTETSEYKKYLRANK